MGRRHDLWVFPTLWAFSCYTLELSFLFSCPSMLRWSTPLPVQVIWRTGNGNSECACVWERVGMEGVETGYVGNKTKHRKSVTWSETRGWFIWPLKESVACGLEERMFSFFALDLVRHNTWKHFQRGHRSVGGEKAPDILFLLPLFIAFSVLFKLIGFHTSVHHMWKHPNEYWWIGEGLWHVISKYMLIGYFGERRLPKLGYRDFNM